MLKRKVGDVVYINPYSNVKGRISEVMPSSNFDYQVKFDWMVDYGAGAIACEYFNEDELDQLDRNWKAVKGV